MKHVFYPAFTNIEEVYKCGWDLNNEETMQTYMDKICTLQKMYEIAKTINTVAQKKQDHIILSAELDCTMHVLNKMYKFVLLWAESAARDYDWNVSMDYDRTSKLDLDIKLLRCKYLVCRDILSSMKACKEIAQLSERYDILPTLAEAEMEKYFRQLEKDLENIY